MDGALVVGGATVHLCHRPAMLAFGLVLNLAGVGLFCWLLFELAVYGLPFFLAVTGRRRIS
jgi:hypothetical protein